MPCSQGASQASRPASKRRITQSGHPVPQHPAQEQPPVACRLRRAGVQGSTSSPRCRTACSSAWASASGETDVGGRILQHQRAQALLPARQHRAVGLIPADGFTAR